MKLGSSLSRLRATQRRLGAALGGSALTLLATLALAASPAAATVHPVAEGSLEWGVKESWRDYIGTNTEVGGGAEFTGWTEDSGGHPYPEGFRFPVLSGSFDDESNTTDLELGGWVHFQGYCDKEDPDSCLLDTKYSDLSLHVGPDSQVLRGTHTGYSREDPGGELHENADVVLAKYDVEGAATDFSGGTAEWNEIPTVAGPGLSIYGESTAVDATSFRYAGPGGAPDLAEKFDTPGAPVLDSGEEWLAGPDSGAVVLHASEGGEVVHIADLAGVGTEEARLDITAYDAETLEPVGTPYTWDYAEATPSDTVALRTAFDPATDSVYFATFDEGEEGSSASVRRAAWDAEAGEYEAEPLGSLGDLGDDRAVFGLAWNEVNGELAAIANDPGGADEYESGTLHRFTPGEGGWQHAETPLRLPDTGEWAGGTKVSSPFDIDATDEDDLEPLGVARDGSYVAAAGTGQVDPGNHHYPALHIQVGSGGEATVAPIAGTRPGTVVGTYYGFNSVAVAADGSVLVHNSRQSMDAYARVDVSGGEAVPVGEVVRAPVDALPPYEAASFANSAAADPGHGINWATDLFDPRGFRLHALEGDAVLGSYSFAGTPEYPTNYNRIEVGPSGDVYLPIEEGGTRRPGYRRLAFEGIAPELTAQPEDRSVTLGVGEESEEVEFSVALAGEADSIQWQSSAPGQTAFEDVEGETGGSLAVAATPALDGTEYRARVSNAAGEIVSDVVSLSVSYAPAIVSAPSSQTVTEGAEAVFLLSADGNPEPEVSWERRVGGFWQGIDPEDVNFLVNGPSLTVRFTNTEQSGARFRARVANGVDTVFTDPARLTVEPRVSIPPEGLDLEDVTLDWTGNEEMQRKPPFEASNYFSAGASDGGEGTYSAAAGDVRVLQVAPDGEESLATWGTRGDHVGGGEQLVRLYGGEARIEPDGSAGVEWSGSFSVNFYGGLVPFTLVDPELEVDAAGSGTLSAEMVGCESSQSEPGVCAPFAARPDVTVATFSGVEIDPAGEVEVEPAYAGVEVEVPEGETPQDREAAGWGAWPQPFVDFQAETGLLSYWYSSGSAFDPHKPPFPFLVDFSGAAPPDAGGGEGGGSGDGGEEGEPLDVPEDAEEAVRTARWPLLRRVPARRALVRAGGIATVLRVGCRGPLACAVRTRSTASVSVGKHRVRARVVAPRAMRPGTWAPVRLRLGRGAVAALRGKRARASVWVAVRSGDRQRLRRVAAVLRGPRAAVRRGAGGTAPRRIGVRRSVSSAGVLQVAALRCRGGRPCAVVAPRVVSTRAAGGRFAARVQTPRRVAPSRLARVRLRLGAGAVRRLADGVAVLRVPVALRSGRRVDRRLLIVRLAGRSGAERPGGGGGGGGGGEGGGGAGGGSPESAPISDEPPVLERPASAVDVESVEIGWYPRDSWVRYASSGTAAGDGILFSGGAIGVDSKASACPDRSSASDAMLPYEVEFAARDSWYDPESGRAGIYGEGEVSFRWKAHTIDLSLADPEIEIDGGDSRAIFRVEGSGGTPYPDQRADLVGLDLGGAPSVSGDSYAYDLMRGTLTANGVNVFAGFYSPPDNDEFGCVSVSFEVP